MRHQRSSAGPLAAVYLLLVAYASLYPFEGWRWPPGQALLELMVLPRSPWHDRFDEWANLLGYAPLGALLFAAVARSGGSTRLALGAAVALPVALSYLLEVAQHFVPGRVPSVQDWLLNAGGAVGGSLLALLLQGNGAFDRWQRLRERWFVQHSAGAITLMLLWPVALLFPFPVPLGLGQIFGALSGLVDAALGGTRWAQPALELLHGDTRPMLALAPAREGLAIALGLLAPCLVAAVVTRPGWRRVAMALGSALLAVVVTTLSTALNFGPAHAFAWLTPVTLPAVAAGTLAALLLARVGPRLAAALGLVALTALVAIVAQAPADPYYAASLQAWEQGRFIRFHGLAQWVGWLWPYAAMAWLLARLARRN